MTGSQRPQRRDGLSTSGLKALNIARKQFNSEAAPEGLSFHRFLKTLDGYSDKKYSWSKIHKGHTYKTFFILGMHFMDNYNYNIERVRRCAIHYSAPNGLLYPFCTYNAGHTFRNKVEAMYVAKKKGLGGKGRVKTSTIFLVCLMSAFSVYPSSSEASNALDTKGAKPVEGVLLNEKETTVALKTIKDLQSGLNSMQARMYQKKTTPLLKEAVETEGTLTLKNRIC